MTPAEEGAHARRLNASASRLADLIAGQALSLARFPRERLSVERVTYDLLAMTVFVVVMGMVDQQAGTADTLVDQLAAELHVMIEDWRAAIDAEEEARARQG